MQMELREQLEYVQEQVSGMRLRREGTDAQAAVARAWHPV